MKKYVQEGTEYTDSDIYDLFEVEASIGKKIINVLKQRDILKQKNKVNVQSLNFEHLLDDGIDRTAYFTINYVGYLGYGDHIFVFYPKYISYPVVYKDIDVKMSQIMNVIFQNKYKDQEYSAQSGSQDNFTDFSLLSIIAFFIEDYWRNGEYTIEDYTLNINGRGEISWSDTVNEVMPLLVNNRPLYVDLYTEINYFDVSDYFVRLYRAIITDCSFHIAKYDLEQCTGVRSVILTDENIDSFGDFDYIESRINAQLNIEFSTRKIILLSTMKSYLQKRNIETASDKLYFYGTSNFNIIWQNVCSVVLGDCYEHPLDTLPLPLTLKSKYKLFKSNSLKQIVDSTIWTTELGVPLEASGNFEIDIISIFDIKGNTFFGIFDAKYYVINENLVKKTVNNQPGIESVTKQFLYELIYKDFIRDHGFSKTVNVFMIPSDSSVDEYLYTVTLDYFMKIHLNPIQVISFSAVNIFSIYLLRNTINFAHLPLKY